MSDRIRVHVVKYADCTNETLRYKDPMTGKQVRRSAGTTNKREARKLAAVWEAELNSGKSQATGNIRWEEFRIRYESEVVTGLAPRTGEKISAVFNVLETLVPQVANGKLRDLTPACLSRWQQELRSAGRSESTIAGHLAHLRAALQWAADIGMIPEVPKLKRPKRAKKGGTSPMKGRPITTEEFERMLGKVSEALFGKPKEGEEARSTGQLDSQRDIVETWKRLLRGLWWSGLRLDESLNLYWDRPDRLCVDLTGRRPMLRIPAELEKGNRDRLLPMSPEFAEFLLATREADRRGRVFRPQMKRSTTVPTSGRVGRTISRIGKLAGVKVHTHPTTGKVKYASAHDLRRSFGERWSTRVNTATLMQLMRHECIQTTMRYYVGRNAETTADASWSAYEQIAPQGTVLGTVTSEAPETAPTSVSANTQPETV